MIGENRKRPKSLVVLLVLALAVLFVFHINPVLADVPTVESVEPWTSGADTILNAKGLGHKARYTIFFILLPYT